MPDIPVTSPLGYVGVFLAVFGFFLILAGFNVIKVEKITVTPGRKTWAFGIFLVLVGVAFLLPEIITSLKTTTSSQELVEPTLANTPTPITGVAPTIYDSFDDPANNGGYNRSRWTAFNDTLGRIYQQNGELALTCNAGTETDCSMGLTATAYRRLVLNTPTFFEAKLKVIGPQDGQVYLALTSDLPSENYANCILGYGDSRQAEAMCHFSAGDENLYYTGPHLVDYETWHTFRIDVYPEKMTFTYYVDGEVVGSYAPTNADEFQHAKFAFGLGVVGSSSEAITGYVDDVRVGEVGQ